MKFEIRRTSAFGSQPCGSATKEDFMRIDERTCDDPKKIPANNGTDGDWYKRGSNHRVEGGRIRRDFPDTRWVIEIESLDDLIEFSMEHGDVIISHLGFQGKDIPDIEIYDDYRE